MVYSILLIGLKKLYLKKNGVVKGQECAVRMARNFVHCCRRTAIRIWKIRYKGQNLGPEKSWIWPNFIGIVIKFTLFVVTIIRITIIIIYWGAFVAEVYTKTVQIEVFFIELSCTTMLVLLSLPIRHNKIVRGFTRQILCLMMANTFNYLAEFNMLKQNEIFKDKAFFKTNEVLDTVRYDIFMLNLSALHYLQISQFIMMIIICLTDYRKINGKLAIWLLIVFQLFNHKNYETFIENVLSESENYYVIYTSNWIHKTLGSCICIGCINLSYYFIYHGTKYDTEPADKQFLFNNNSDGFAQGTQAVDSKEIIKQKNEFKFDEDQTDSDEKSEESVETIDNTEKVTTVKINLKETPDNNNILGLSKELLIQENDDDLLENGVLNLVKNNKFVTETSLRVKENLPESTIEQKFSMYDGFQDKDL